MTSLVGNGQLFTAFGTAGGKDLAAVLGGHTLPESVFVSSLSVGWLKCTLHITLILKKDCKNSIYFLKTQCIYQNYL